MRSGEENVTHNPFGDLKKLMGNKPESEVD